MKIFNKSVWSMFSVFFAILLAVAIVGNIMANQYSAQLNSILGIDAYKIVDDGEKNTDTQYYKSQFYNEDGTYNDKKMRDNSVDVATRVGTEGAVLLWNNNKALPLAKASKISLFGITSVNYLYGGQGSGHISITTTETVKSACEAKGLKVNAQLFNAYKLCRANKYGMSQITNPAIKDPNYGEFRVNEVPYSEIDRTSLGKVTNTVAQFGDAAVMIISRNGSECIDTDFYDEQALGGNYMDLTKEEAGVLEQLKALKTAGTVKKVVLLINTANAMQFKNIKNYDVDACVWMGMAGNGSLNQVAEILSGEANPSGGLTDTYVYDNESAPANENFGDYTFTAVGAGLPNQATYTLNNKYVVYQEGIYVGYRYYETRYEDSVIKGRNANASQGVKAGSNNWNYSDEVAFPFGHGLSYTNFTHSDYTVKPKGDNYEVSMTIKNVGDTAGKDIMQIYVQKPYTDYDKANKIEKSAVELVGFAKTKNLAKNESETLKVIVKGEDFKTYDAYGKKTYILEKGDYYLAAGENAHDALNNILSAKGYKKTDGMDADGNSGMTKKISFNKDDFDKYAVSSATNKAITNQFDKADINLYEGTKDQKITYLSRNDWGATYPSAVNMSCINETMIRDMQYGTVPNAEGYEMPKYETIGEKGKLSLMMLKDADFDDPVWDDLLNQMTFEEQSLIATYGANAFGGAESVAAPGCKSKDGPGGIGINNKNLTSLMGFPCEGLMAATFNEALVEELGNAFGMEILHVGYTGIYGPGVNVHRSAYSGRAWEYYSEDGFMSGKMFAAEVKGLQNRGVIVIAKHFLLNDQERNRYGGTVWANEQSIREIYLKAFELGITEGKANGLMSSFNRLGCEWTGKHKGLLTEVLRNEWGFKGLVETDAGVGDHMLAQNAMAEGIIAGNDVWMSGGNKGAFNAFKNNAAVCQGLREASHRILYTQLHSSAMNGVSETARVVKIVPWWQAALTAAIICVSIITAACIAMTTLSFVFKKKKDSKNDEVEGIKGE